jgi:hypothetical protein
MTWNTLLHIPATDTELLEEKGGKGELASRLKLKKGSAGFDWKLSRIENNVEGSVGGIDKWQKHNNKPL